MWSRVGGQPARVRVDVADVEPLALVADPARPGHRGERGAEDRQPAERAQRLRLAVQVARVGRQDRRPAPAADVLVELVGSLERLGGVAQAPADHTQDLVERAGARPRRVEAEGEADPVRGGELDRPVVALVPVAPARSGVRVDALAQVADAELVEPRHDAAPVPVGGVVVDDVRHDPDGVAEGGGALGSYGVGARRGRASATAAGPENEQPCEGGAHVPLNRHPAADLGTHRTDIRSRHGAAHARPRLPARPARRGAHLRRDDGRLAGGPDRHAPLRRGGDRGPLRRSQRDHLPLGTPRRSPGQLPGAAVGRSRPRRGGST